VAWVDARADMNTPSTSTSGNVHGMSLAALSGLEPAELASIGDVIPTIRPDRVALLGIRLLTHQRRRSGAILACISLP
jgi:arginase